MVNQQQGIESPANLLQQHHNYDVQVSVFDDKYDRKMDRAMNEWASSRDECHGEDAVERIIHPAFYQWRHLRIYLRKLRIKSHTSKLSLCLSAIEWYFCCGFGESCVRDMSMNGCLLVAPPSGHTHLSINKLIQFEFGKVYKIDPNISQKIDWFKYISSSTLIGS